MRGFGRRRSGTWHCLDWIIRQRGGAAHLNWHLLAEMALPNSASATIWQLVSRLNLHSRIYAPSVLRGYGLHGEAALLDGERRRLRPAIDALAAVLYGVEADDFAHVLHETDLPVAAIRRKSHELNVCGFWRVDRDKDPELRHTVLTLIAFHDLEAKIEAAGGDREQGIEDFLAQNDGEGWMLPETLRLADYGLGHDERAQHPQPVASRLGPRFYDRQLARSADESRRECHLHARNLLGAHDYALLLAEAIGRHAADADSDDTLDRLTDPFIRDLTGEDGYLTLLLEIRARNAMDEAVWWTTVDALQTSGHLAADHYGALLDELHARGLLDDLGYRRRRGRYPPAPSHEPLSRVAEPDANYHTGTPPKDG